MNFISLVQKLVLIYKKNIDGWRDGESDGWKNIEFRRIYG